MMSVGALHVAMEQADARAGGLPNTLEAQQAETVRLPGWIRRTVALLKEARIRACMGDGTCFMAKKQDGQIGQQ